MPASNVYFNLQVTFVLLCMASVLSWRVRQTKVVLPILELDDDDDNVDDDDFSQPKMTMMMMMASLTNKTLRSHFFYFSQSKALTSSAKG